ncbi:PA14 domain-containing protein [Marinobacter sp.]|uniref:PA14 domain-containing protein n=1 Tax=Marinobacter sp. TaxID=50741 RepID=UPI003851292F
MLFKKTTSARGLLLLGSLLASFAHGQENTTGGFPEEAAPHYLSGFTGEYFRGTGFSRPLMTRTDPAINFSWGRGGPAAEMPVDRFSVRWSGLFTAPHREGKRKYLFNARTDDGVRLFLADELVIDEWKDHGAKNFRHTAVLEAGQRVSVIMEYYENQGSAVAQLSITDMVTGQVLSTAGTVKSPSRDSREESDRNTPEQEQEQEVSAYVPREDDSHEERSYEDEAEVEAEPESRPPPPSKNVVTLSWTAPLTRMDGTSIALSEIDYYEIRYGQKPEKLSRSASVESDETSYRFRGLGRGSWYFTVRVVDRKGLVSPESRSVATKVN